ncbi:hypothetical protein AWN76_014630 [Rhodothermaceae bacterium RA]|nr:hypothetical protein AWN76_014630 [Rhodothermaceae bacterium RA]
MDVNGTRFHLLIGRRDWTERLPGHGLAPASTGGVVWNDDQGCITLQPELFRFPTPRGARPLPLDRRRGAARDGYGHWFAIDEAETGVTYRPHHAGGTAAAEPFWPHPDREPDPSAQRPGPFRAVAPAPSAPDRLRGLAITTRQYLAVGITAPRPGLLLFDLHAGGPPMRIPWPVPFHPSDLAPRPEGGLWVLDVEPGGTAARLWRLEATFQIPPTTPPTTSPDAFRPIGGEPRTRTAEAAPTGLALPIGNGGAVPVALEGLPDDTVLVLYRTGDDHALVRRLAVDAGTLVRRGPDVDLTARLAALLGDDTPFALAPYDLAFVPDDGLQPPVLRGTLYAVGPDGDQVFAFRLFADDNELRLEPRPLYLPLRRFSGKALVAAGADVYYDFGDRWLRVTERPRAQYVTEGTAALDPERPFDGKEPGCVWHRLFLDACIPPGTSVRVDSRAADDAALLASRPWQPEPAPYRRATGSEVPFYRPFSAAEEARAGTGTWELLLQQARGRYLQLRLTLQGDGRSTPRLYALRLYYNRFSYLDAYLPAVYRQDPTSASFLDRFLANVEGTFTEIEGKIAAFHLLLDTRTLDGDYLDWLAGWLGVTLDPAFDEARRRLFLDHAVALFGQRGTPQGLARALRLVLDPCPDASLFDPGAVDADVGLRAPTARVIRHGVRIIEHYLQRRLSPEALGDPTAGGAPALTAPGTPWTPQQGIEPLHQRFRTFLRDEAGIPPAEAAALSLTPRLPADPALHDPWRRFIARLGIPYAEVTPADAALYRAFLRRRYGQISRLHDAYPVGHAPADFDDIALPSDTFPPDGAPLVDWVRFASLVVPMHRRAHRFTVLIPVEPRQPAEVQQQRLALAERIINLEKPAHTQFEVRPYRVLFRVGTARLGFDTVLDLGSRYAARPLGQGALAEATLAAEPPWTLPDRLVTGRDRPGTAPG